MTKSHLKSPVRWFGGKGNMIAKFMPLIPRGGHPYCEPFMGGASLFFVREPAPVEVLNDLNRDLVNLFRVLQNKEQMQELQHRLLHTLYSREEFGRAIELLKNGDNIDAITRAWAFFVVMNQGFSGKEPKSVGDWGRAFVSTGGVADTANNWIMRLTMVEDWHKRLLMAQIDNRDALEVIRYWDTDKTVFYCDPPYHLDTRKGKAYKHELDHDFHVQLVDTLLQCKGSVTLSGYDHEVYRKLDDNGWKRVEFKTACHAAGKIRGSNLIGKGSVIQNAPRTEVVWMNPKCVEMLEQQKHTTNNGESISIEDLFET